MVVRDRIELSTFRFSEGLSSTRVPPFDAAPQPVYQHSGLSGACGSSLAGVPTCAGECRLVRVTGVLASWDDRTCVALVLARRPKAARDICPAAGSCPKTSSGTWANRASCPPPGTRQSGRVAGPCSNATADPADAGPRRRFRQAWVHATSAADYLPQRLGLGGPAPIGLRAVTRNASSALQNRAERRFLAASALARWRSRDAPIVQFWHVSCSLCQQVTGQAVSWPGPFLPGEHRALRRPG